MTEKINGERAMALLTKVVESAGPDRRYMPPEGVDDMCVYFGPDGAPACIVGHVLSEAGVGMSQLRRTQSWAEPNEAGISVITIEGVELTDDARDVLGEAQDAQDVGRTWGEALESARTVAGLSKAASA